MTIATSVVTESPSFMDALAADFNQLKNESFGLSVELTKCVSKNSVLVMRSTRFTVEASNWGTDQLNAAMPEWGAVGDALDALVAPAVKVDDVNELEADKDEEVSK